MKYSTFFSTLFLLAMMNTIAAPLKRQKNVPFPADFKAWEPQRVLNLEQGAIARIESGKLAEKGVEEKVQLKLSAAWGVTFPIMEAAAARAEGRPLILVGKGNGSLVARRLLATTRILPVQKGAETRVFPELFDWKTGAVFLGGGTAEAVLKAADALTAQFGNPRELAFMIQCEDYPKTPVSENVRQTWLKRLYDLFTDGKAWLPRTYAVSNLRQPYLHFLRTGDESAVHIYSEMLKMYEELYGTLKDTSDRPPTFSWHNAVWQFAGMEDSPLFTAEDRARAARLTRMIGEDTMNYWEMSAVNANYDKGIVTYYTNHPIFASRTSYFSGEYLLHRYNYEPARYWMAAAANAMEGVEPHSIGPEDAPGYHHLCTSIFINYALASGKYDLAFFRKPAMQDYFVYTKAQWAQTMRTPGYGDSGAMGDGGSTEILGYAVDIFDDPDAKGILSLIGKRMISPAYKERIEEFGIDLTKEYPISDRYDGLLVFPMDDFRLEQRKAPKYDFPILDKAYFRSGWEGDGDFLLTSGLNRSPHGHCDLNAILRYGRGRNVWLTEGHYILYGPEEHNTLSLRVNGRHIRPDGTARGALGQVRNQAMTPSKRFAVTRVTAEEYGPSDWTRTIVWNAKRDFWIIDELKARESGEFLAEYRWRSLGEMKRENPQTISFHQLADTTPIDQLRANIYDPAGFPKTASPTEFFIHGGDAELELSSQDQPNSLSKFRAYNEYSYADPVVRVVLSRQRADMQSGDVLRNAHFFNHEAGAELRKLAEGAWTAAGQLVLMGPYQGKGIAFDGEQLYVGPNGVIGFGVYSVQIGAWKKSFAEPTDIALDEVVALPEAIGGEAVAFAPCAVREAEELFVMHQIKWHDEIVAFAAGKSGFGVGDIAGNFSVVRPDGTEAWSVSSEGAATVVCPITDAKGQEFWVVGYDLNNVKEPESHWCLYDGAGKQLATQTSTYNQITTIFPFHRAEKEAKGEMGFVVGSTGWMAVAYDLTGKKLWAFKCYHNMISGTAADCDGDGIDEIMLGAGYYYHQMINAEGKLLFQRTNAAWNYDTIVSDINGDGKPVFICGREDNAVHAMTSLDRKYIPDLAPIPLGGVPVKLASCGNGFAVAVENGTVVRVGQGMKVLWRTELPSGLGGLAEHDGKLYTVCRDDFLYELDSSGKVTGKFLFETDSSSPFRPIIASGAPGLAAASARKLIILQ